MSDEAKSDIDSRVKAAIKECLDVSTDVPAFGGVYAAAEQVEKRTRRFTAWYAGAGIAAAAVAVVLIGMPRAEPEYTEYIRVAELMETTQWTAPSDVLLPSYQFDIYQELPALLESTKPAEGALL